MFRDRRKKYHRGQSQASKEGQTFVFGTCESSEYAGSDSSQTTKAVKSNMGAASEVGEVDFKSLRGLRMDFEDCDEGEDVERDLLSHSSNTPRFKKGSSWRDSLSQFSKPSPSQGSIVGETERMTSASSSSFTVNSSKPKSWVWDLFSRSRRQPSDARRMLSKRGGH